MPVTSNLFDQFGGGGVTSIVGGVTGSGNPATVVIPKMSTSCPANVKEEMRTLTPEGLLGE